MRRHSLFDSLATPAPKPPPFSAGSAAEPPALSSVAEDATSPSAPPSSAGLPRDSISVASTHDVPSIVEPSGAPGPASLAGSDYSHKHRRFSMLRFRNASDSQLAAKAKLHAAAEKPPPVPRRTRPSHSLALAVWQCLGYIDGPRLRQ